MQNLQKPNRAQTAGLIAALGALLILVTWPRPHHAPPLVTPESIFIATTEHARLTWINAPNDLARVNMRAARAAALCQALPSLTAQDWTGTLTQVEPTIIPDLAGQPAAAVEVTLSSHITLATPADPLFNAPANMVAASSPLYQQAATIPLGTKIKFSARFLPSPTDCMDEESFTPNGSMQNPRFKIILTALAPA